MRPSRRLHDELWEQLLIASRSNRLKISLSDESSRFPTEGNARQGDTFPEASMAILYRPASQGSSFCPRSQLTLSSTNFRRYPGGINSSSSSPLKTAAAADRSYMRSSSGLP